MGCLNSKTYIIWKSPNEDGVIKFKCSSKGVQDKRNTLIKEDFKNVLTSQEPKFIENAGFIRDKDGVINTYTQYKQGMSFFYAKRKVLEDNVSTTHLNI